MPDNGSPAPKLPAIEFDRPKNGELRFNITSIISYADTTNPSSPAGPTTETLTYDMAGNVIATSKACCEQISSVFELSMQYAFPASQTRGSADPSSLMRVTTSATYDLKTGLPPRSSTDANGRQTTTTYSVASLRPEVIVSPTGATTTFEYDDAALKLTQTTRASLNGIIARQTVKYLNGLGQVRQERVLAPKAAWDIVDTEYDSMGGADTLIVKGKLGAKTSKLPFSSKPTVYDKS